jgi:serine/threonine protein kinase/Flp pilus assembly protein TadD
MSAATPSSFVQPTVSLDLADRVAGRMAADWRRGDCRPAESYLECHPELLAYPEQAVRLVYEEVCLRQERGEDVAGEELAHRFPDWAEQLAVLLDCHRLVQARLAIPSFPVVGESLGDFRLVAELGVGAHGRVYLATQPALADRPVVLKVTPRRAREHLSLARLQHTHIVPLHAMYDFPERNLRALCMPYLGGATLARLLDRLRDQPAARRSGRSLVEALDAAGAEAPVRLPGRGGYRTAFAAAPYVEAVCRIGACLADGLHYAHERGLVHLDLKPSNVLLTAEAQPLLLDFHLALHPLCAGQPAPDWFGGTPGVMAPEQEAGYAASRQGAPVPADVDGRADIYALGRLLYLALAGGAGVADHRPSLHQVNPQVSVGLSDVVHRCLAPRAEDRYSDAAALAADLRRHLAHLPLRGVANRSLRERWHKWRRRRPDAVLWGSLVLALVAGAAALTTGTLQRYGDARAALAEGREQMQRGAYGEAVITFQRARDRAAGLPRSGGLVREIEMESRRSRRAAGAVNLHVVVEHLRFLAGADSHAADELESLEPACREAWAARGLFDDDADEAVRRDLFDLGVLGADLMRQLGRRAEAEEMRGGAEVLPVAQPSAWQHVVEGRALLRAGELDRAAEELTIAAEMRPDDFWAHFYGGVCAYRRRQYADAVQAFGVATALAPASAECYCNRALAYAAQEKTDLALRDYDRALALAPRLGVAALNRGVLHYQAGRLPEARADLERALRDGASPAAALYNLALVHLAQQDPGGARAHLNEALNHDPAHAEARSLLEHLQRQR